MKAEMVESWWHGFEWCILNAQKVWSCNKFKKMKCLCNRWVFVRNPDTSKEIVQFVHEVHPVFAVTLSTFLHILCGWNDDTMPSFNFSEFICSAFQFQGNLAKKISKCMKNSKISQKGLKIDDVALNGGYWTHKKSGGVITLKKMKCLWYRRVFVRNPDTSKEIVRFVHEVHPVFAVTLSTFLHMLCGWNDDTMPSFDFFRVHL